MAYLEHDGKQATEHFETHGYECDCQRVVKPSVVLRYFQEIAGLHCELYGLSLSRLFQLDAAFLLTRVQFTLPRPLRAGERLTVSTWHRETRGVQYIRDNVIRREDGSTAAKCVGYWVLVSPATRKIRRPAAFTEYTLKLQPECALDEGRPPKLSLPDKLCKAGGRTIRYTDLDHNGHLNNCNYADFILDFLPCSMEGRWVSALDIHFISEALLGDTLSLSTALDGNTVWMRGEHSRGVCFEAAVTLSPLEPVKD